MTSAVAIRNAQDEDGAKLIDLVSRCYAEYSGCVMDPDGLDADLPRIATVFSKLGGQVWVAEREGGIVGMIGLKPGRSAGTLELCRLYVHPEARRQGLGARLCGLVEQEALARGAQVIELWSDTRFTAAHALYRSRGYEPTGGTRLLHDPSNTTEMHFCKVIADSDDPES